MSFTYSDQNIVGDAGDNELRGSRGNDSVAGQDGNDVIYGGSGNDLLLGGKGRDVLYGGNDDDMLYGGQGDDLLIGSNGNDYLSGDMGADTLEGGNNADVFAFNVRPGLLGSGVDTVLDFVIGTDKLAIVNGSTANVSFVDEGADVGVFYDDGSGPVKIAVLNGVASVPGDTSVFF